MSVVSLPQHDHRPSHPSRRDRDDTRSSRAATGRPRQRKPRRGDRCAHSRPALLGAYFDACGRGRELVALTGRAGSVLVIDRDAATLRDRLLLAHLSADEPAVNVELVCRDYLSRGERPRPRRLLAEDLLAATVEEARELSDAAGEAPVIDLNGQPNRLCRMQGADVRPELRWSRPQRSQASQLEPVSLRELVGTLESYEPMRSVTAAAIRSHRHDRTVSVRHLQGEYRRLCTSPVVLNRALREAVLRATASGELTMSEIALRCGIVKRDRRGGHGGETSWLARRVGLMAEGGATHITPWIHSDVLALIAREGLRMSPHEVEVL
ncbi:MAG TPA: hypothetical protein VFW38_05980 [Solirubrobacteraceae bacterium]|nr:hypothetical protein [Solirubrobacteraceae bacterium]